MLPSLRLRLVAGFGGVILLTLVFASVGAVLLLRDQQTEFARERYGRLVDPFAIRVQQMELVGLPLSRIRAELVDAARYYEIRVILLDQADHVVLDTDPSEGLLGLTIDVSEQDAEGPPPVLESYRAWHARWKSEDLFLFVSAESAPTGSVRQPETRLVVAVPAEDVTAAWEQLFPRQAVAGGLALVFAVLISSLVADRITRPLRQMTHASEAIAKGNYDQRIEVTGDDEVAQLARAFNDMASEVGRSQRATRQLIANMTHDLKTPLTSIQGFSQAIVDGLVDDPSEYKNLGAVIHDEAEHMNALVNDLLYLSRIDAGELALTLEDIDLDTLVAATARRLRYQSDSAGVEVRLALDSGTVRADGRRLEQVFSNLLDNAIRFAPQGSEVLLRSYIAGTFAVVEVHNGGDPIPGEALPHVFDRFFQGDPSRRRGHQGLGLAIVHDLVQAHAGEVSVQSAPGSGTTFTVRLRRAGPEPRHSTEFAPTSEGERQSPHGTLEAGAAS